MFLIHSKICIRLLLFLCHSNKKNKNIKKWLNGILTVGSSKVNSITSQWLQECYFTVKKENGKWKTFSHNINNLFEVS